MTDKHVIVIGGGVAGLSAALQLARFNILVDVIEQSYFMGGTQFALPARPRTDAVIVATGFTPYHPDNKPYGYRRFKNVVTNLELEEMLRDNGRVIKTSDIRDVRKIAFIQCAGSRDARLNHLWCSRVCCGSSLRMARLIQSRQPDTAITVFYIDIQTFGKDFESYYASARKDIQFQRAIPGDIFQLEDGRLRMAFLDGSSLAAKEENFDLVVLAIGLCPPLPIPDTDSALGIGLSEDGFIALPESGNGVFAAGTATGPMSIAESVASADSTAWSTIQYLK